MKLIYLSFIIALLLCTVFNVLYFSNFNGSFSYENSDWGNFGDYIGGTVIPIITLLNVIILFNLMKIAQKIQEKTSYTQIKQNFFLSHINKINKLFFASIDAHVAYISSNEADKNSKRKSIEINLEVLKVVIKIFIKEVKGFTNTIEYKKYQESIDLFFSSIDAYKNKYKSDTINERKDALSRFIENKAVFLNVIYMSFKENI